MIITLEEIVISGVYGDPPGIRSERDESAKAFNIGCFTPLQKDINSGFTLLEDLDLMDNSNSVLQSEKSKVAYGEYEKAWNS